MANAVVFSMIVSFPEQSEPFIEKMTCDVTDINGQFEIDVLNDGVHSSISISPVVTGRAGQQGSKTLYIDDSSSLTLDLGNIDLAAANNIATFYSWDQFDYLSLPSNVICSNFVDGDTRLQATCAIGRGLSIPQQSIVAMKVGPGTFYGESGNTVKFYLSQSSTITTLPGAFAISGLTGDQADFNGRWASANELLKSEDPDGSESTYGTLKYVEAPFGGDPIETAILIPTDSNVVKLDSKLWLATTTLAANAKPADDPSGSSVNLNDGSPRDAQLLIFSRNKLSSNEVEQHARFISIAQDMICRVWDGSDPVPVDPPTCTPFVALTTPLTPTGPEWASGFNTFLTSDEGGGGGGGGGGCGQFDAGNLSGTVVTQIDPVSVYEGCGYMEAVQFDENAFGGYPGWNWDAGRLESSVDSSGNFGLSVPDGDSVYRLTFTPSSDQTYPTSSRVLRFLNDGSTVTVESCSSFSLQELESLTIDTRCTSGWQSVTPVNGKVLFLVEQANFYGQVLLPDGSPVPFSQQGGGGTRVEVKSIQFGGQWNLNGDGSGSNSREDGKFLFRLNDGYYKLEARSPESASYPPAGIFVKVEDGVPQLCTSYDQEAASDESPLQGCSSIDPSPSWEFPVAIQFTEGDMTGRISVDGFFWVQAMKKVGDRFQNAPELSTGSNQAGTFSLTFGEAGEYKLYLNPPQNDTTGATRTEVLITVTITDGVKALLVEYTDGTDVTNEGDGIYDFEFAEANFQVLVVAPDDSPVADSWVNVQKLELQGGRANFTSWVDSARTNTSGLARMSIATAGWYKLQASNPTSEPYPDLSAYIQVKSDGATTFHSCSDFDNNTDRDGDSTLELSDALICDVEPVASTPQVTMQFVGAEFRGQVVGVAYSWIELHRLNSSQCESCFEWVSGTQASQNGLFGVNFGPAGTYKLVLNPAWNDQSGSTRTEIEVVVTGTEGDRTSSNFVVKRGSTVVSPTNGVYLFSLSGANLFGVVRNGASAEPYANVSFEKFNSDNFRFEWSSQWANANRNGQFSANLADGLWKATARPGQQSEGTVTPVVAYMNVEDGEITAAYMTQECADGTEAVECIELDVTGGDPSRYIFALGSPNFSGYVWTSKDLIPEVDGSIPEGVSPGANAVGFTWMEVLVWNEFEQQYRWSPEVSGINTSSSGQFAANLPAGNATTNPESKYQVIVNSRPQDSAAGRSRGVFNLKVVEGEVRCDQSYAPMCASGESPSTFHLYLVAANFTGTLKAGLSNVANGQVRADRWNGQWFQWSNLWANTNSAGKFAMNLSVAGTYKVTADAPWWNSAYSGYASAVAYIKVGSDGVACVVTDENDDSCDSSIDADFTLDLIGANVVGEASSASGPVRNSWVNVMRYNSVLGWWEWASGAPINNSGDFSLSLVPTRDGDSATTGVQQRFKLEIMPPWGNSSLTRKEVQLWVGAVNQTSGDNFYRVCSTTAVASCPSWGDASLAKSGADGDILEVVLTSGNLKGMVTEPDETAVPDSWISVEKWTTPSWSASPMWQWVELFGNSNQAGNYNLNLESQGAGSFRVTANPSWNNPRNMTRSSIIVKQDAEGNLCSVSSPDGACADTASNPLTQSIQLVGSNLAGTLKNGASSVPFVWISLMKEQNNASLGDDDTRSNTWYQWLGGSSTNASGTFGMRLDSVGRYQLEVNPPWNQNLTRFSTFLLATDPDGDGVEASEIRVCSSRTQSNSDCAESGGVWSTGSNSQLSFPTANVVIRVCDKDDSGATCSPVENAWVNIFSGYQWIGGSNTNNLGVARFKLENGTTYRVEASPNWSNPDGIRVETNSDITIEDDLLVAPATGGPIIAATSGVPGVIGQIDIRLGSPNVVGSLFYEVDPGTPTLMPWAYVGVRKNNVGSYEWLPGSPVDGSGSFKLSLGEGTYTLTAYANPNVADRAPISMTVTVNSSNVADCDGVGEDGTGNGCSLNFDAAVKNVIFEMTGMGTYSRALYVLDAGGNRVMTLSKTPSSGSMQMKFTLAEGTYTLKLQKLNTFSTTGTGSISDFSDGDSCRTHELVVGEGGVIDEDDQAALNAWGDSFDGDDATTGLECKSS